MKILFFGDSITDMGRDRSDMADEPFKYGSGYVRIIASELFKRNLEKYDILNKGIGGNRIVDMYARVNRDVWENKPDVLTMLVGINDICHPELPGSGTEPQRYENIYQKIIEETLKRLPNCKIILLEPFVEQGWATLKQWEALKNITQYAEITRRLAQKYGLFFVPLQKKFDEATKKYGVETVVDDGIHPCLYGSLLIANEWLGVFDKNIDKGR